MCVGFDVYRTVAVGDKLSILLENDQIYADFERLSYWETRFNNAIAITVFLAWIKVKHFVTLDRNLLHVICYYIIGYHLLWHESYFSFQPVLHDWCNKGCGMCNPVCGMVHIKEPLLLIGKSSLCGGSGFPLLLSEWSFTICLTPYNRK